MNTLDQKINTHFAGLVVRKDLVKTVKGNAIVPTYVLEYLLGQYCATSVDDNSESNNYNRGPIVPIVFCVYLRTYTFGKFCKTFFQFCTREIWS